MIKNEKMLLIKFLFKNQEQIEFFNNEIFSKLNQVLSSNLCYSKENINEKTRDTHKKECIKIIKNLFINNDKLFKQTTALFYDEDEDLFERILNIYVYFLTKGKNIFEDKFSVCFILGLKFNDLIN